METKQIKGMVEAISKAGDGILIDKKWHTVTGKALDYVKELQKNSEIEYSLNTKNQIIFLRVLNNGQNIAPPKQKQKEDSPAQLKDRAILLQVCIKAAASLPFIKTIDEAIEATNKFLSNAEEKLK